MSFCFFLFSFLSFFFALIHVLRTAIHISGGYNLLSVHIVPRGHLTQTSTVALEVLVHTFN